MANASCSMLDARCMLSFPLCVHVHTGWMHCATCGCRLQVCTLALRVMCGDVCTDKQRQRTAAKSPGRSPARPSSTARLSTTMCETGTHAQSPAPSRVETSMDVLTALLSTDSTAPAARPHTLTLTPPTPSPDTSIPATAGTTVTHVPPSDAPSPARAWISNFTTAITTRLSALRQAGVRPPVDAPNIDNAAPNTDADPNAGHAAGLTPSQIAPLASAVVNRATAKALTFLTGATKEVHFLTTAELATLAGYRASAAMVRHVSSDAQQELDTLAARSGQ
eukprot:m.538579 g.538579  ORF g.538579 m.538579 type:complete len:279 (-) comp22085_c0_seq8:216-1052(-)